MLTDFRYALRLMRRTPLFTLTVVLTVALAIAANTAIFSVVNTVLIRPLPYADPGRLVQVAEKNDKLNLPSFGASVLNFLSWREQAHSFTDLAGIGFGNFTLNGGGEPEQLSGNLISPALTRVLGVRPILGREFNADEEKPGSPAVALIGEGLWKRRFASDPSLIGRSILLNGVPTTVVGIAPASLNLISGSDVYTPLVIDPPKEIRLNHVIIVFGRLKHGVSLRQAQAEMDAVSTRVGQQYPEVRDWGINLITLFDTFVSPQLKTALLVLLAAVWLVLLIACANIANLLLARAAVRRREMAVRTAVGATPGRLLRQMLVESVVLSGLGGLAGILGALGAVRLINLALPANLLPVPEVQVDSNVLLFAGLLTVLTGLLFGLAPALRTSRVDLNDVLKQTGRTGTGGRRGRLISGLAASEFALATVLLISAGLLIQTLARLEHAHLGFSAQGLTTFQLAPPPAKYPVTTKAPQFYRELLDRLRSIPGVKSAAVSSGIPLGAGNYTTHPMIATGESILPPGTQVPIDWRIVSPGYFHTMSIPLLRGRDFTDADGPNSTPVVIVSQATARRFWGDADPLGHTLVRSADRKTVFTVIGMVGDVRDTSLNQESPALYYSLAPRAAGLTDVVVRSDIPSAALLPAMRQKVHELDSELALANVRTMEEWVSTNAAQPRLNAILLGVFAAVALMIASLGVYGMLAYSVNQRTREIGLRMALGAQPASVMRLVIGEGMKVGLVGIALGLAGALATGRALVSLVYGVPVRDTATYLGVALVLAAIALAACAIPARRASRVDPLVALRCE